MGTTSDKLTYLNTTKSLIKDNLNLGGANITNEPFREYSSKLEGIYKDFLANGTDTLWNNWEKVSGSGTTLSLNNTIKGKMEIEYGGNTSQEGTPTPDSPISINVVSGDNTLEVVGKNLFNNNDFITSMSTNYQETKIIDGEEFICLGRRTSTETTYTYKLNCKENTQYTISLKYNNYNAVLVFKYSDGTSSNAITPSSTEITEITATSASNKTLVGIQSQCYGWYSSSYLNIAKVQLEEGTSSSSYEPYQSTIYPINLGTTELCKIGDYKDRIYYDNGKWYLEKNIGKVVLDGTQGDYYDKINRTNTTRFLIQRAITDGKNDTLLSNYFVYSSSIYSQDIVGIWKSGIYIYISVLNEIATTVADFKTWLSTHNTEVLYILATPTYTEITDTTLIAQLEEIKYSYENQTNISQTNDDLPFELDVVALKELL
jgi:hypothetical protein